MLTGDEERLAQFERSLDLLRQQYRIPGLSAAVVHNRQLVWAKGFGFQDIANNIPATPDTPYRIASLTKTFASMLLMRCVEQNRVDLNSLIANYTSGITQSGVRIRHVFTHTSESTPPGEKYIYNGNRYAFLTPVIDSCTGKPFRQALAETILDPLEMRDSVPGQDLEFPTPALASLFTPETLGRYSRVIARLAKPYALDGSGRTVLSTYPNRGISASAGLISTVRDLARYDAAIDRHLLLKAETQELAWRNAVNSRGQQMPYANGWFVQDYFGSRLIWHYGYWPTFSALILKVPSRNVTLILLANSDGLSAPFSQALGGFGDVTGSPFAKLFLNMMQDPNAFRENPIDGAQFFIRQQYQDFLSREPDADGLQSWLNVLNNCSSQHTDPACDRVTVSAAFFGSPEFRLKGYFAYRFYKLAFKRLPQYVEINPDMISITGETPQEVFDKKAAFAVSFAARAEFASAYSTMSNATFVSTLLDRYALTSVTTPAPHEPDGSAKATLTRNDLIARLDDNSLTRAQVLRAIADSDEVLKAEFNSAFIAMQYYGYLRRTPEESGYNDWLGYLNTHPGDFRTMVHGFVNSNEYRHRFESD
ncbi:MAG TPA: serine hydrolase [Pyrinomonadaceae bacterium]|nr:serine hydrolase [Pyrinomonadaceae bacterium]